MDKLDGGVLVEGKARGELLVLGAAERAQAQRVALARRKVLEVGEREAQALAPFGGLDDVVAVGGGDVGAQHVEAPCAPVELAEAGVAHAAIQPRSQLDVATPALEGDLGSGERVVDRIFGERRVEEAPRVAQQLGDVAAIDVGHRLGVSVGEPVSERAGHGRRRYGRTGRGSVSRESHPSVESGRLSAPSVTIRPAEPADAPVVTAIYNEGIAERQATFETRPREPDEIREWIDGSLPVLVAECDGAVVGFARIRPYSDRAVYAGVGEHGVYVASAARRLGAGRALLDALAEAAAAVGLHKLTSRIFATNAASIALHRAAGFRVVGTQRRHARLDGTWRDAVLVERLIGEAAEDGEHRVERADL